MRATMGRERFSVADRDNATARRQSFLAFGGYVFASSTLSEVTAAIDSEAAFDLTFMDA